MATLLELIATAQNNLAVVLAADPTAYVDYRIGDKSVKKSQYVQYLLAMIKQLRETESKYPDADISQMAFDFDVTEFGEDQSEYEL